MQGLPKWENGALLVLRLALGVIFVMHGSQKMLGLFGGHGLLATVENFQTNLGVPAALAYAAVFTEFFGGIALILGLLTRLAALGIGTNMGVAMWKVHLANGFFLNWTCEVGKKHGFEYNLALLAMALALVLIGAGNYSLDHRLTKPKPRL